MEEVCLHTDFLGKKLKYPLLINAITGGIKEAKDINRELAIIAAKYEIAMAVGSQSISVENPARQDSFTVVRDLNPAGVIIANMGANTGVKNALKAVQMIQADALQLHFNVPQELAMWEGDRDFSGVRVNVREIVKNSPVPIIAKEVGFGFSKESVMKLYEDGVSYFDCGGKGGTNFIAIEGKRRGMFLDELDNWGIPTAVSLAEIISLQSNLKLVASGGIRTAQDAAKALAMGADLIGLSGPLLKILLNEGKEALNNYMEKFLYQLQAAFLMTGSKDCEQIKTKPLIILNSTADWLKSRGIDPYKWGQGRI